MRAIDTTERRTLMRTEEDLTRILELAARRVDTLTYTSAGKVRHVCNDSEEDITGELVDVREARRETYSLKRRETLRPCCWTTYGRMHS